jgi:formylglycine-generating enzyme required for sulfatase activity
MASDKLTILFLAADPVNMPKLQLDEEQRAIDRELRLTKHRDRFDLRVELAVRYSDLQELLLRYEPSIVHFSGHGSEAGELLLKDASGSARPVPPEALARLFARLRGSVRCVVLNACYSERQAAAIAQSVDCVVGMARALSDEAARDFAAGFYLGLGYGRSVGDAFGFGCDRLGLGDSGEEDTPKLLAQRVDPSDIVFLGDHVTLERQDKAENQYSQVFLAYSRSDGALMRRLRADLLAAGIGVWVDEQDLAAGTLQWHGAIERAIAEAQCMVVILSPHAKASEWVNIELELARRRKLTIFPVLAHGSDDEAVPPALILRQYIDMRNGYEAATGERLLPALRKHLGLASVQAAPLPAAAEPKTRAAPKVEKAVQPATVETPQPVAPPADLEVLLDWDHFMPEERNAAGERLGAEPGDDRRRGVGLQSDGLPDIDWVEVPEMDAQSRREFIYQQNERRVEPTFWMARYPITYLQFEAFVKAPDGIAEDRWWKGLDAAQNVRGKIEQQSFRPWNHPRDNVTWYAAVAFCRWLTHQLRGRRDLLPEAVRGRADWRISLPTEWQWEKAARGHDGRRYPWGAGEYKSGFANIDETDTSSGRTAVGKHYLKKTSAVGMYPHGASPYGICDLSGNVWEWCLNEYQQPKNIQESGAEYRVLRGGSWNDTYVDAAAVARAGNYPHYWLYGGLRVVCAVPVS